MIILLDEDQPNSSGLLPTTPSRKLFETVGPLAPMALHKHEGRVGLNISKSSTAISSSTMSSSTLPSLSESISLLQGEFHRLDALVWPRLSVWLKYATPDVWHEEQFTDGMTFDVDFSYSSVEFRQLVENFILVCDLAEDWFV